MESGKAGSFSISEEHLATEDTENTEKIPNSNIQTLKEFEIQIFI
jgi:hypothetical protein